MDAFIIELFYVQYVSRINIMSGVSKTIIIGKNLTDEKRFKIIITATGSLFINIVYAFVNLLNGLFNHSFWFITLGAYYTVLSVLRFTALMSERKISETKSCNNILFIQIFSGIMLIFLSIVLCGSVYLSLFFDVIKKQNEIFVITMAVYAFTKITIAIINFVKRKELCSPVLKTIRNISLADAAVSILSLQRSMLITFEGMSENEIMIMNGATGSVVWIGVCLIGIMMLISSKKENL